MNLVSGLAVYFVCWWISLLAVLPLGVRTQAEEGKIVPGTVSSAPVNSFIGRKLILASFIAFVPWGVVYLVMEYNILSFEDFPFVPEFSND